MLRNAARRYADRERDVCRFNTVQTSIDTDQDDQQVLLNFLLAQISADELSE